jgi:lipid A 3-O-deacylase
VEKLGNLRCICVLIKKAKTSKKREMEKKTVLLTLVGSLLLILVTAQPCAGQNRGVLSFGLENDFFAGTDRYYTNGIKLTWTSPFLSRNAVSVSFGQSIYTPYDIEREDLIEDDRPYAGITYFTLALHKKRDHTIDTLEFLLGIVGPSSLAAQIQRFVHSLYRGIQPQGWQHQLKDEIVMDIVFDKKWRVFRSGQAKRIAWDLIGHAGGSLGTMMTAAATGWQLRFGSNLPRDFGTCLLRPGGESGTLFVEQFNQGAGKKQWGIYGYIYFVGHAVFRNIFLDGNTFAKSHRVDKYSFIGDAVLGFVISKNRLKFSYSYDFRTKQFRTQAKPQIFGAINISYVY